MRIGRRLQRVYPSENPIELGSWYSSNHVNQGVSCMYEEPMVSEVFLLSVISAGISMLPECKKCSCSLSTQP